VVCRGVQTDFKSSLPASFPEKVVGAIPQFVRPKTKRFAVKFRRILEVLCLQVLKKRLSRNSTICASKSEAVCREVQTHFGSSLPASFTEKVVGAIPQFMRPKTKLFALKFRRILGVLCLRVLQTILGAIPRFVRPKMKLFAVKFRHILEVLRLQGLQRNFWTNFHDLCVQKRSCLL